MEKVNDKEIASALAEAYGNEQEAYVLLQYDLKELCLKKILVSPSTTKVIVETWE